MAGQHGPSAPDDGWTVAGRHRQAKQQQKLEQQQEEQEQLLQQQQQPAKPKAEVEAAAGRAAPVRHTAAMRELGAAASRAAFGGRGDQVRTAAMAEPKPAASPAAPAASPAKPAAGKATTGVQPAAAAAVMLAAMRNRMAAGGTPRGLGPSDGIKVLFSAAREPPSASPRSPAGPADVAAGGAPLQPATPTAAAAAGFASASNRVSSESGCRKACADGGEGDAGAAGADLPPQACEGGTVRGGSTACGPAAMGRQYQAAANLAGGSGAGGAGEGERDAAAGGEQRKGLATLPDCSCSELWLALQQSLGPADAKAAAPAGAALEAKPAVPGVAGACLCAGSGSGEAGARAAPLLPDPMLTIRVPARSHPCAGLSPGAGPLGGPRADASPSAQRLGAPALGGAPNAVPAAAPGSASPGPGQCRQKRDPTAPDVSTPTEDSASAAARCMAATAAAVARAWGAGASGGRLSGAWEIKQAEADLLRKFPSLTAPAHGLVLPECAGQGGGRAPEPTQPPATPRSPHQPGTPLSPAQPPSPWRCAAPPRVQPQQPQQCRPPGPAPPPPPPRPPPPPPPRPPPQQPWHQPPAARPPAPPGQPGACGAFYQQPHGLGPHSPGMAAGYGAYQHAAHPACWGAWLQQQQAGHASPQMQPHPFAVFAAGVTSALTLCTCVAANGGVPAAGLAPGVPGSPARPSPNQPGPMAAPFGVQDAAAASPPALNHWMPH
jgi:hypothetical protein